MKNTSVVFFFILMPRREAAWPQLEVRWHLISGGCEPQREMYICNTMENKRDGPAAWKWPVFQAVTIRRHLGFILNVKRVPQYLINPIRDSQHQNTAGVMGIRQTAVFTDYTPSKAHSEADVELQHIAFVSICVNNQLNAPDKVADECTCTQRKLGRHSDIEMKQSLKVVNWVSQKWQLCATLILAVDIVGLKRWDAVGV